MRNLMTRSLMAIWFVHFAAVTGYAEQHTFTTDTTIDDGEMDFENFDITIRGCTVTINGEHTFNSLTIERNASSQPGVLAHATQFKKSVVVGVSLHIIGNMSIQGTVGGRASKVDLDGRGWPGSQGGGHGYSTDGFHGGGGGYGGAGGDASGSSQATQSGGLGGDCHGYDASNLFAPKLLGSGGGNGYVNGNPHPDTGGPGGGAIRLVVDGTLTVNGQITAKGANGTSISNSWIGGAGSGGSIFLTCGSLAGNGSILANGGDGGSGGGGGGGRIAVLYAANTFTGTIGAFGGPGANRGGAGTVYMKQESAPRGKLIIYNNNNFGEATEFGAPITLESDVEIRSGGRLGPKHGQDDFELKIIGDMNVMTNGALFADGRGWPGSQGDGFGYSADGYYGGGGGYGGIGGSGSANNTPGGGAYGNAYQPVNLGSGGGNGYRNGNPHPDTGGPGGGAIRLVVDGMLTVNGQIAAKGANGMYIPNSWTGGAGSGGSIYLTCRFLDGNGSILANGGEGGLGGGGGGGRIAIYTCNKSFQNSRVTVSGGTGFRNGQAGSVLFLPDHDLDSDVDFDEYAIFNMCINGSGGVLPIPECQCSDIDGDSDVDLSDFSRFQRVFTGSRD